MNRLKSIIALRVYVCVCGAPFKTKNRERENHSICQNAFSVIVQKRQQWRWKKKENIISKACRQEVSVFHSSSHPSVTCSPFALTRHPSSSVLRALFICSTFLVGCSILCSPSLSLSLSVSLQSIKKTSIAQLCSEHITYMRKELTRTDN